MPITTKGQYGFAMLEVLVSMLVIMFGVLGIAGMQMLAINNTETARYQSAATILANSMVAKMQANYAYWGQTLLPPAIITVNGTVITSAPAAGSLPVYAGTCIATACSPTQMAYYDVKNWAAAMAGVSNDWVPTLAGTVGSGMALPPPQPVAGVVTTATISCNAATPEICTLTMYWSEKNIALGNATGAETGALATGTVANHSYQTMVSILQ